MLRCPLIAQLQRNVYVDKQKQELIEQNGLLFKAEFNNESYESLEQVYLVYRVTGASVLSGCL